MGKFRDTSQNGPNPGVPGPNSPRFPASGVAIGAAMTVGHSHGDDDDDDQDHEGLWATTCGGQRERGS